MGLKVRIDVHSARLDINFPIVTGPYSATDFFILISLRTKALLILYKNFKPFWKNMILIVLLF